MQKAPIYIIESHSRQVLADTFMRFQEYYESPKFKGRVFSIDEFVQWYAGIYGSFTYAKDWYGFNIPSKVLDPFRKGDFNPLTPNEQKILEISKSEEKDFYIIGVTPSAEYFAETVRHEFVHGAFFSDQKYRNTVINCLKQSKIFNIEKGLSKMGYDKDVFADEANAYLLVEPETITEYATKRDTEKLRARLSKIFKNHFGFSVLDAGVASLMNRAEHILI